MKGTLSSSLEPGRHLLAQDGRSEGAEGFAALDLLIEDVLHVGAAWIAEDAAIPERARSPLEPALEPADDFALADGLGGGLQRLSVSLAKFWTVQPSAANGLGFGCRAGSCNRCLNCGP